MKKPIQWVAMLAALGLLAGSFVGCATGSSPAQSVTPQASESAQASVAAATPTPQPTPDISKSEELVMYLMGSLPNDAPIVIDAINAKLKTDLNCSVTVKNIDWTDWQTKYRLVLASGENVDSIYTANWCLFSEQALKGAFMPLNDLVSTYCPDIWAQWPKAEWPAASVGGKIYAIPAYEQTYDPWGVAIRGDLRKKYNIPEITSFDGLAAFLDAIKANEPNMIPFNVSGSYSGENFMLFQEYSQFIQVTQNNSIGVVKADQKDITDVKNFAELPEFADFCKLMRQWFQKGYWSMSVLSDKVDSGTQLQNMLSAVSNNHFANVEKVENTINSQFKDANAQIEFWSTFDVPGEIHPCPTMQNAMAIPAVSKNPERMLMVINLLSANTDYNRLITYGIKGTHWDLTADGQFTYPPGVNESNTKYPVSGMGQWAFRNPNTFFTDSTIPQYMQNLKKHFIATAMPDKLDGFNFDNTNVQTECAAVDQVLSTYLPPLLYGTAADTDVAIQELKDQLKQAGVDKVITEMKNQLTKFKQDSALVQ